MCKICEYQRLNRTNLNSPVPSCLVVNPHCAIGKGVSKSTAIHGAKRGDYLQKITRKNQQHFTQALFNGKYGFIKSHTLLQVC